MTFFMERSCRSEAPRFMIIEPSRQRHRITVCLHLESRVKNKENRYNMGPFKFMSFVSYFGIVRCLKVSQHATGSKQAPKLPSRPVTLCSTLNLRFAGEADLCFLHILFILLLVPAAPNRLPPMAPSRTPPNATGTVSTASWTSSPACCPSARRSGLGWTSCRCCVSASAT